MIDALIEEAEKRIKVAEQDPRSYPKGIKGAALILNVSRSDIYRWANWGILYLRDSREFVAKEMSSLVLAKDILAQLKIYRQKSHKGNEPQPSSEEIKEKVGKFVDGLIDMGIPFRIVPANNDDDSPQQSFL
ncbi:MAG: hypothetical protein LIO90_09035 [Bacteroidales bacterium]|nr:hypothetical protein [Bacteroidales bacterium]